MSVAVEQTSIPLSAGPYGQLSVGDLAPVRLSDAFTPLKKGVVVRPVDGDIYVGYDNAVADNTGFLVSAGGSQSFPVDNLNQLYLISATGTVTVCYIGG